jgi:hypothetical protein
MRTVELAVFVPIKFYLSEQPPEKSAGSRGTNAALIESARKNFCTKSEPTRSGDRDLVITRQCQLSQEKGLELMEQAQCLEQRTKKDPSGKVENVRHLSAT